MQFDLVRIFFITNQNNLIILNIKEALSCFFKPTVIQIKASMLKSQAGVSTHGVHSLVELKKKLNLNFSANNFSLSFKKINSLISSTMFQISTGTMLFLRLVKKSIYLYCYFHGAWTYKGNKIVKIVSFYSQNPTRKRTDKNF